MKKWGFINKQGEIVVEPQFSFAEDFKNNFSDGLVPWVAQVAQIYMSRPN